MTALKPGVVGILAGGGSLPREIAEAVTARGGAVHIVAIKGEADQDLRGFPLTRVGWGQIGGMIAALKGAHCDRLVIVGSVRRPDLSAVRPDLGLIRSLPSILRIIAAGGDDSVLSRVVRFFEEQGFKVVAPASVAPELLIGEGPLGRVAATPDEAGDVARGFEVIRALGPYDVGQAVVIAGGRLEAVEGVAGTDAMLVRLAEARRRSGMAESRPVGVLVKRPKPGQELRVDLPAIGPATIGRALEARLAGIAVLAGGALALERGALQRRADEAGIFVQGFADREGAAAASPRKPAQWRIAILGRRRAGARERADAETGAGLLAALEPFGASRCAIVDGGHVLAVEGGEGAAALIRGAGALRQWGRQRWARRSGVAVLADAADLEGAVEAAAAAALAGVAVVGQPPLAPGAATGGADRSSLFLAALSPLQDGQHGR